MTVSTLTDSLPAAASPTLPELLTLAESKLVTSDVMTTFVATFFDNLKNQLAKADFSKFFQLEFIEHDDFRESTAKRFIVDILSREKRGDNFVTAEISRKSRRGNPLLGPALAIAGLFDSEQYTEEYHLELNCKMSRAQLCATLTPKFSTLQRIVLVVTCAPSLETSYVFEVVTQHMLRDFGKYDADGSKAIQRWYKFDWRESTDGVVRKISDALSEIVRNQIENTATRLSSKS